MQEYRVTTHNATAEQGRNSGANVAIATRSGTNEIHGTVFHFFRSLFGRHINSATDTLDGDLLNSRPQVFPGFPPLGEVYRSSKNTAIGHRWTVTDSIVNEFTMGLARFRFYFTWGESNPDFPKIPPFDFADISEPVHNIRRTQRTLNTYQLVDNLSWVKGAHVIRTGINFRFLQHNDLRGFAGFNIAPSMTFAASDRNADWVTSTAVAGINSIDNPLITRGCSTR